MGAGVEVAVEDEVVVDGREGKPLDAAASVVVPAGLEDMVMWLS